MNSLVNEDNVRSAATLADSIKFSAKTQTSAYTELSAGLRVFVRLMPFVGLMLGFIFARIYNIDSVFPYFVDELRHIERGRIIWEFSDIRISTTPGKFLLYYWLGFFELPANEPGWVARSAVSLFTMIGAAGTVALGRKLFSLRVGLLALAILSLLPFMVFYERLALSDPIASSTTVIMIWWSLMFVDKPTKKRGIILGIIITLMLMAKILAAPLVAMPIAAILFFHFIPNYDRQISFWQQLRTTIAKYLPALLWTALIVGVVWGIILGFYLYRGMTAPDETSAIVDRYLYEGVQRTTGELDAPPEALWKINVWRFEQSLFYLWGPIMMIMFFATGWVLLARKFRAAIYLLLPPLVIWLLVIFAAGQLSTRYMILPNHMMIVFMAGSIWYTIDTLYNRYELKMAATLPLIAVLAWGASFSVDFYQKLVNNPVELEMPTRDEWEYFKNQSGWGFRDGLRDIMDMPSVSAEMDAPIVYGLVRNCQYLSSHVPSDAELSIECSPGYDLWPRRDFPNRSQSYHDIRELTQAYGEIYMLIEDLHPPILDEWQMQATLRYVKTYNRPFDGIPVHLYIAIASEPLYVGEISPNGEFEPRIDAYVPPPLP